MRRCLPSPFFLQYWLDHSDLVDVGGPASDPARKLFYAHEAATRDLKKAYSQTSALIRPIQKGKTWAIGFGSNVTDEELQALVAEMEKKEFLV